jgi:hypothetical protein
MHDVPDGHIPASNGGCYAPLAGGGCRIDRDTMRADEGRTFTADRKCQLEQRVVERLGNEISQVRRVLIAVEPAQDLPEGGSGEDHCLDDREQEAERQDRAPYGHAPGDAVNRFGSQGDQSRS